MYFQWLRIVRGFSSHVTQQRTVTAELATDLIRQAALDEDLSFCGESLLALMEFLRHETEPTPCEAIVGGLVWLADGPGGTSLGSSLLKILGPGFPESCYSRLWKVMPNSACTVHILAF